MAGGGHEEAARSAGRDRDRQTPADLRPDVPVDDFTQFAITQARQATGRPDWNLTEGRRLFSRLCGASGRPRSPPAPVSGSSFLPHLCPCGARPAIRDERIGAWRSRGGFAKGAFPGLLIFRD